MHFVFEKVGSERVANRAYARPPRMERKVSSEEDSPKSTIGGISIVGDAVCAGIAECVGVLVAVAGKDNLRVGGRA